MMRFISLALLTIAVIAIPSEVLAQRDKKDQEAAFVKSSPKIGEKLPVVTAYLPDGRLISTTDLRGHYTVLTFGCLT